MATVTSTFRKTPAYKYIREADKLPTNIGDKGDPICKVKLFNPTGGGTWYLASYDPATEIAYGVAEIQVREAGPIYMPELVQYRGRFGLPIERDLHWDPKPMSEILKGGV